MFVNSFKLNNDCSYGSPLNDCIDCFDVSVDSQLLQSILNVNYWQIVVVCGLIGTVPVLSKLCRNYCPQVCTSSLLSSSYDYSYNTVIQHNYRSEQRLEKLFESSQNDKKVLKVLDI